MIAATIWKQLVATLEGSPVLSRYVKYVYQGRRFDIEPNSLPCIMLEPVSNGEIDRRMNNIDYQYFNVEVYAFSSNNFNEFPKNVVGDCDYKGILDVENDIRACLKDSYSLGGIVTDVKQETALFDTENTSGASTKYPVRGLVIPLRILYRQVNGV